MSKKEPKQILVLTLPLKLEPWQYDRLNRKMNTACKIYNTMLKKRWKLYLEMTNRKDWKDASEIIKIERRKAEEKKKQESPDASKKKKKGEEKAEKTPELIAAYEVHNQLMKDYGFSKYGLQSESIQYASHYSAVIPSTMAQMSIGKRMWSAFDDVFFGTGDEVSFKRWHQFNSLSTDGKSGMRLIQDENDRPYILVSNRSAQAKPLKLYFDYPKDLYGQTLFACPIKVITLVRRQEKSKWHYYVQFSVDASGCTNEMSNPAHPVGFGKVGLAIWRGDLYAVSEHCVKHFNLNPWREEVEPQRDELTRQMEVLKRQNNPDNYNVDGTAKKGRRHWNHSRRYLELARRKRELERVNRERRALYHRHIVYELLEMGDEFVMYDYYFRTEKEKYKKEEEKTSSEFKKEKDRRKSIQEDAPSALLSMLSQKLKMYQRPDITRYEVPERLYWYQHIENTSQKELLPHRTVFVDGEKMSQTAYRAFLMLGYQGGKKSFDKEYLDSIWPSFLFHLLDCE